MISSGTVNFQFSTEGLPAGSTAIVAHIYTGSASVAGPVLVNTGVSAASPVQMPSGSGSFTASTIAVEAATIQSIIDNPAGFYFNVHTLVNPSGAVRGQLVRR